MMQEFERATREAGRRIVDGIVDFLPGALVLLSLLAGALLVAIIVRYLLLRALRGVEFDRGAALLGISLGQWAPARSGAEVIASAAYWLILAVGLLLGLTALDADLPTRFATAVLEYIPHLAAALLILVVGIVVARFLARAVLIGAVNMQLHFARALSITVKWLVLIVAAAMALDHIGIGRTILLLAFGIVFGGIVLAIALAVGLGSRDTVSRALERDARARSPRDQLDHL
jgi:hypothetical protein